MCVVSHLRSSVLCGPAGCLEQLTGLHTQNRTQRRGYRWAVGASPLPPSLPGSLTPYVLDKLKSTILMLRWSSRRRFSGFRSLGGGGETRRSQRKYIFLLPRLPSSCVLYYSVSVEFFNTSEDLVQELPRLPLLDRQRLAIPTGSHLPLQPQPVCHEGMVERSALGRWCRNLKKRLPLGESDGVVELDGHLPFQLNSSQPTTQTHTQHTDTTHTRMPDSPAHNPSPFSLTRLGMGPQPDEAKSAFANRISEDVQESPTFVTRWCSLLAPFASPLAPAEGAVTRAGEGDVRHQGGAGRHA